MAEGRELLLGSHEQLKLSSLLLQHKMFGIAEDEADYITLKSGRRSPHYFDIRKGISINEVLLGVGLTLGKLTRARATQAHMVDYPHEAYTRVAMTPEAMTSYGPDVSRAVGLPLIQPRVDLEKASGNKSPVLGIWTPGDRVAAYDDVITDGASKISTIRGLGGAGLEVVDYFVVLDREEGGVAEVKAETGLEVVPALAVSNMILALEAEGEINQTQFDNVREYLAEFGDPAAQAALGIAA